MAQAVLPEELHKTDTDRSSESDEEDSNLIPYHFEPGASSESTTKLFVYSPYFIF